MARNQWLRRKHEREKVCVAWHNIVVANLSWPNVAWCGCGGQPNDSRGGRDDGRGGEPLLKPGSLGPCPIDGFRRVEETSTSCRNNG